MTEDAIEEISLSKKKDKIGFNSYKKIDLAAAHGLIQQDLQ